MTKNTSLDILNMDNFDCVEWKYKFSSVKVEAFDTNSGPWHRLVKDASPKDF